MKIDRIENFIEPDGILCPISLKNIPFEVKRIFYVTDVPSESHWRGGHAHKQTQQYLICVRGKIEVTLTYNVDDSVSAIIADAEGVFIKEMVWDTYRFLTEGTVALVLCSTEYDPDDYINDFIKFSVLSENKKEKL